MNKIYLDYAATTPIDTKVLKAMAPYFSEKFGNPMSIHSFGREAEVAMEKSRKIVADFLHCYPSEVIFTSGATESNNLAIKGVIKKYSFSQSEKKRPPLHIITTAFEHHCVLNSLKFLEKSNQVEVTYLPVYKEGIIKIEDVKNAIRDNTRLISIMYVNNEIGTVQPVFAIGKLLKKINAKRNPEEKIIFHTDATQAINYFDCDVKKMEVDLLSLSGHKIYGPKGTGVLYVKKGTAIGRVQDGGDQEFGMRAGTHNVPGIVGLAEAIKKIQDTKNKMQNIVKLRDYLIKKVLKKISEVELNGSKKMRSPNNANFSFTNVEGESLVLSLDAEGVACSTGSACSTGNLEPSHVLLALGLRPEEAHGSLRVSLGKYTTKKEIDVFIRKLSVIIKKLRNMSGDVLKEYKS